MGKNVVCLIFLISLIDSQNPIDPQYNYGLFMTQFGRKYEGEERDRHQRIFEQNYADMLRRVSLGEDLSVNQFMDWDQDQFRSYLNYRPTESKLPISSPLLQSARNLFSSPLGYDWRELGMVTSIKRQGTCGGCWAFSAIAQYESLLAISTNGTRYDLSQQFAIQCETQHSRGCNGGNPIGALRLFNQIGIPLQQAYPFKQTSPTFFRDKKTPICTNTAGRVKLSRGGQRIQHYENLTVEQIQRMLINHGPLTVGVYSKNPSFLYAGKSGLINFCTQGPTDHAVLLVGFNSSHWFIKNSWGTNWGHNGFGYIQKTNDCNLKKYVDVFHFEADKKEKPPVEQQDKVNIVINMTSSNGKGWDGNVLGVRQNGLLVGIFGEQFQSGFSFNPITVAAPKKDQIQIIVVKHRTSTQSLGFTISIGNKTVHSRSPGQAFPPDIIFATFCPSASCSLAQTIDYYLTLTDEWGDKWDGTVLGFRSAAGPISNFTLEANVRRFGPRKVTFQRFAKVSIYVVVMGSWTEEIGFQLRTPEGRIVAMREAGNRFYADTLLAQFCVDCLNLNYVEGTSKDSTKFKILDDKSKMSGYDKHSERDQLNSAQTQIRKLNVAICFVSIIASVFALVSVIFFIKIMRERSRRIPPEAVNENNTDLKKSDRHQDEDLQDKEKKKQIKSQNQNQNQNQNQTYQNIMKKPSSVEAINYA